jgi:integrase
MSQARELLAALVPPYDLMARWQLYTGLRVGEPLRLTVEDIFKPTAAKRAGPELAHQVIDVLRKGRKSGYVIASASLLEETAGYVSTHRRAWLTRLTRKGGAFETPSLFIGSRGTPVSKLRPQRGARFADLRSTKLMVARRARMSRVLPRTMVGTRSPNFSPHSSPRAREQLTAGTHGWCVA